MKKIDLGQTTNTLANLGVIVGILLLVYELTQSRDMMRAQIRNEISANLSDAIGTITSDTELANLLVRSNNDEELTEAEALRVSIHHELLFRYWENVHYQYRQGLYDESEFSAHRDAIAAPVGTSTRMVRYWCSERMLYSIPFMEFIDGLLPNRGCQED